MYIGYCVYHNLDRIANLLYFTDEIVPWIVKLPQSTTMQLTIILCVVCSRYTCKVPTKIESEKLFRTKILSDQIASATYHTVHYVSMDMELSGQSTICSKSEINCILMI